METQQPERRDIEEATNGPRYTSPNCFRMLAQWERDTLPEPRELADSRNEATRLRRYRRAQVPRYVSFDEVERALSRLKDGVL